MPFRSHTPVSQTPLPSPDRRRAVREPLRPRCGSIPWALQSAGCRFPASTELGRRVRLALDDCGFDFQKNICAQQLERLCSVPGGVCPRDLERCGKFLEIFGSWGGV